MQKEKFEKLASEKSNPSVTISMNTHRTHPENLQDAILLKRLCKETEERLISEFGKREILPLLENLELIPMEIDTNYNLDSVYIFLSNETKEIVKSAWPAKDDRVQISDTFAIGSLIKSSIQDFEYLIVLLSQNVFKIFVALNNAIVGEIENDNFFVSENTSSDTERNNISDLRSADNTKSEYFNKVDKVIVKVFNQTNLNCVVICTDDNYSSLLKVADKPAIYKGHKSMDPNNQSSLQIAAQAWEIIHEQQEIREMEAIEEMKEAVGHGKAITDLRSIFKAAKEGRGDLLMVSGSYSQAIKMTGDTTFKLMDDATQPDVIDDITSVIAREVLSKKGRVLFTDLAEFTELGDIILKTRY
ncbi:MAG: hypothetical protein Q7U54_07545 [Bacteroidales bacterium]|nr:hypothetical protein [Bacteroidales bacterium]